MNKRRYFVISTLVILGLIILSWVLVPACVSLYSSRGTDSELRAVNEVWQLIKSNHVNKQDISSEQLAQGAIKGMLAELQDPHAVYFDPQSYKDAQEKIQGKYEGIGAMVTQENDEVIITGTIPNSPAEKVGIATGDKILKVDGADTAGLSLTEVVARVRGEKGTSVKLQILHRNQTTPVDIEVVRDEVGMITVTSKTIDNLGYIRIIQFTENTSDELQEAMNGLVDQKVTGLILDLRYNPGGLLTAVIDVASQFIKEDLLILYQIDGNGERTDYNTQKQKTQGPGVNIPVVVLVNKYSASGSEVLAGALKFHNHSVLIGNKTFGKGSVNQLFTLSDGSAVYLSIAHWYTPDGLVIEGKGLEPDINVDITGEDEEQHIDRQLDRAVEELKKTAIAVR